MPEEVGPIHRAAGDGGVPALSGGEVPKRSRVLLSCAPCRVSKLKCDREVPCGNCLKKARTDLCSYAPKPPKPPKPKGMAARLQRLEGMLREVMADDGTAGMSRFGLGAGTAAEGRRGSGAGEEGRGKEADPSPRRAADDRVQLERGRVVMGARSTTYVGATHFMAMLDDIEDLKSYFEDAEGPADDGVSPELADSDKPEFVMLGSRGVRSKFDLMAVLPPRPEVDKLVVQYLNSNTPSSHTIHRPTFARQYSAFWLDPSQARIDWLGVLFGIMALGVHFVSLAGVGGAAAMTPAEQFKLYRSATLSALATGGLARPNLRTIQALLLFNEAEFLVNRASQTNCWLVSGTCIRLMLHMGLHRDPSGQPNISAFDGEMRRRMWHLAIQLDLIVSFHMGLPSLIHGIPSDTQLPHNLLDADFDEDAAALPPARPASEYTDMSYAIGKSMVCRVFGQVARLAHALTPPSYADVLRTDALLLDTWRQIPGFLQVRPLADCVADPPRQVVQRFGLASLFHKSRCVLHRPYLAAAVPRPEHAYSRRTCLQAALALLRCHESIFDATQPGGLLHKIGWFVTGLGMHDFLLAAMIVYLVVQNAALFDGELVGDSPPAAATTTGPSVEPSIALPVARNELVGLLVRSYRLWAALSTNHHEVQKAADLLELMVSKIRTHGLHDSLHGDAAADMQAAYADVSARPPISMDGMFALGHPLCILFVFLLSSLCQIRADLPLSALLLFLFVSTPRHASPPRPLSQLAAAGLAPAPAPLGPQLDLLSSAPGPDLAQADFSRRHLMPNLDPTAAPDGYASWIPQSLETLDWDMVDDGLRASSSHPTDWIDRPAMEGIDYMASGMWDHSDGVL